jgi:allantoin racemase
VARVLVVVPFALDEAGLAKRRAQQAEVTLSPDIEFDYRGVKCGPGWIDSHHDFLLADMAMYEAGLDAEHEGYDAVCMDTMSDSGVEALRSMLEIPVIGPAKACFLTALMLGNRFGILSQWEPWTRVYYKLLQAYGLKDKCASIRHIDTPPDVTNLLGGKAEVIFPKLLAEANRCVEEGAESIIIGSTTMHEAYGYLAENLPVPVINPGPLTYKLVEFQLGLRLTQSRKAYPKPMLPLPEMAHAMLEAARASVARLHGKS